LVASTINRVARERAARVYGFGKPTWGVSEICALAAHVYPGLADHADTLIRHLPASRVGPGARILDVGCGDGRDIAFLNSLGYRASGVELDPKAVHAARAKGLDVIEGDLASAAFADESYDVVTSSHVLEHLHNPRAFLAESRRVLKTGGFLVTITPNGASELLTRHGRNWRGLEPPRHIVLYNAENLAGLASESGLREVHVKRTAHLASFLHVVSTQIAANGRAIKPWAAARLWLESKAIEARMMREARRGVGEGAELTLIARK
jgi:2-polyprenyl-3-methyl-5-hydroxy-6-metoxy-1,4-benzoquinol methylase